MTLNIEDIEFRGFNPEGKKIWKRVKRKNIIIPEDGPPPPENFSPDELSKTHPEPKHRILSNAQAYFEAMEEKEK